VNRVFADTLFWGALIYPRDQYHARSAEFGKSHRDTRLVTTEEVLAELLDGLASRGTVLRRLATQTVEATLEDTAVVVHRQSHESFLAGLELYRHRADKGYSLVDCVSMNTMRRERIAEVLTNDRHFTQEGFRILLP
jgi:predicted nucleic acid-binding protein